MLVELLPWVDQKVIETCPFSHNTETTQAMVSTSLLEMYARGAVEWKHVECFPNLIELACMLPQKEDNLRSQISKALYDVSYHFCWLVLWVLLENELLAEYLRKLLLEENHMENPPTKYSPEIINAIRFIWFEYHHIHYSNIIALFHPMFLWSFLSLLIFCVIIMELLYNAAYTKKTMV
ncbi:hypothetical protein Ahy_B04g073216 isoform B [Arachis hypogaea]|uniref:Uncharacterized protein n=1 Tax=Arachis hypogaea TaxID=3818 RepID=A0A444ZPU2_ARAHY|nr:hypothetical protein Ahy_B04g073216 isoform B [Arachis hypogaea]